MYLSLIRLDEDDLSLIIQRHKPAAKLVAHLDVQGNHIVQLSSSVSQPAPQDRLEGEHRTAGGNVKSRKRSQPATGTNGELESSKTSQPAKSSQGQSSNSNDVKKECADPARKARKQSKMSATSEKSSKPLSLNSDTAGKECADPVMKAQKQLTTSEKSSKPLSLDSDTAGKEHVNRGMKAQKQLKMSATSEKSLKPLSLKSKTAGKEHVDPALNARKQPTTSERSSKLLSLNSDTAEKEHVNRAMKARNRSKTSTTSEKSSKPLSLNSNTAGKEHVNRAMKARDRSKASGRDCAQNQSEGIPRSVPTCDQKILVTKATEQEVSNRAELRSNKYSVVKRKRDRQPRTKWRPRSEERSLRSHNKRGHLSRLAKVIPVDYGESTDEEDGTVLTWLYGTELDLTCQSPAKPSQAASQRGPDHSSRTHAATEKARTKAKDSGHNTSSQKRKKLTQHDDDAKKDVRDSADSLNCASHSRNCQTMRNRDSRCQTIIKARSKRNSTDNTDSRKPAAKGSIKSQEGNLPHPAAETKDSKLDTAGRRSKRIRLMSETELHVNKGKGNGEQSNPHCLSRIRGSRVSADRDHSSPRQRSSTRRNRSDFLVMRTYDGHEVLFKWKAPAVD